MAGLVPAISIHVEMPCRLNRDCRDKRGNDARVNCQNWLTRRRAERTARIRIDLSTAIFIPAGDAECWDFYRKLSP